MKFFVCALLISILITPAWAAFDINSKLVGHWSFDEGSGTSASDTCSSDNPSCVAHPGTLKNGPVWAQGPMKTALSFSKNTESVEIKSSSLVSSPLTVCAWISPRSGGKGNIGAIVTGGLRSFVFHVAPDFSNSNVYYLYLSDGVINGARSASFTLNELNQGWVHACVTRDAGNKANFYISDVDDRGNALLSGSANQASGNSPVSNGYFYIGGSFDGIYTFDGVIDDVRVYNRVLSTEDIGALHQLGKPPDTLPPTISNISYSNLSTNQVTISWTTNESSDSKINYGTNISYGQSSNVDPTFVTTHEQTITGLIPDTLYHYQVSSTDKSGNTALSNADLTFKTARIVRREGSAVFARTCDQEFIQDAIDAALDGDTVLIPEGVCTWNITLAKPVGISINNKKIILKGAGKDKTIITADLPYTIAADGVYQAVNNARAISVSTSKPFRLTGFKLQGSFGQYVIIGVANQLPPGTPLKGWRIDHIEFNYSNPKVWIVGRPIYVNGFTYGVIDHNDFLGDSGLAVEVQGHGIPTDKIIGDLDWSQPLSLGTDNAVYMEDNKANYARAGGGFLNDLIFGGRMVIRHNDLTNITLQTHAGGHGGRGGLSYEIYENKFFSDNNNYRPAQLRSGTGVIFNNTITGNYYIKDFTIDNVRTSAENGPYGLCNGLSSYDGNTPGEMGWPCMDQIGRASGGALGNQPSEPLYSWNNNAGANGIRLIDAWGTINPSQADHVKKAGDPKPHTGGVVDYVNNGILPKPGYVPYVYPHPLTTSGFTSDSLATGDVSNDGKVTMYDAALVFRYTMGVSLTDSQKTRANINGDKNADGLDKIDKEDVLLIVKRALGL